MSSRPLDILKELTGELDPEKLQLKFLMLLMNLQNVERGSIWIRKGRFHQCVEALGSQSEKVKGLRLPADKPSIAGWVIENGQMTVAEPGNDPRHCSEVEADLDVKSTLILCFPLVLKDGSVYGAVQIIDTSSRGRKPNLDPYYLELLQEMVDIGAVALSASLAYASQLKKSLRRGRADKTADHDMVVGVSDSFHNVLSQALHYADTDYPVLLRGESGTGKELLAWEIHRGSRRSGKPFLVQNCSAIPDTLLESELFGYVKGAFTGAVRDKVGLFEAAGGGTVFLDEIGDMPAQLQAKLLRVLQENEIKPLGGSAVRKVDVRIVSATNRDLEQAVAAKEFRQDLYYRLNVLPLRLPSLRERREDIPLLLEHFMRREAERLEVPAKRFTPRAAEALKAYPWPGNVRELENFVKQSVAGLRGGVMDLEDIPDRMRGPAPDRPAPAPDQGQAPRLLPLSPEAPPTWEEMERSYALSLLERFKWNVSRAALAAGVNRSTFDSRLRRLGIRKS